MPVCMSRRQALIAFFLSQYWRFQEQMERINYLVKTDWRRDWNPLRY